MKKFGFTLAEVLICIGILGVVAAVTLPALNSSVQKQQIGPGLAKAISAIKMANDYAMEHEHVRDLEEILPSNEKELYFEYILAKYMEYDKVYNTKNYKQFDKVTSFDAINNKEYGYQTKDGMVFFRIPADGQEKTVPVKLNLDDLSYLGKGYTGKYWIVYVDINGINKRPNSLGRDVFQLWVDTKGIVIPYGGAAYKNYTKSDSILWHNGCKKDVTNAELCAGSVVDNAYKVIYDLD